MAASILVRDVLYRFSSQLNDLSPQFTRWTQREALTWLNDAQKAIAKYLPWSSSRLDAIKLKPGTKQSIETIAAADIKPGDGSDPSVVLGHFLQKVVRNMGADGTKPGRAIQITDAESLDAFLPDWHSSTGAAVQQYVFDPRTPKNFYVYPGVPATGSVWVEVSYLCSPKEIKATSDTQFAADGTDNTTISVDDKHIDEILNYMLARAFLKDSESAANAALGTAYAQLFNGSINAQAAALTGVNPNLQSLPFNNATVSSPAPKG